MKTVSYKSLPRVAALPSATGLEGVTVELTTDKKPYYCDGVSWVDLSATGGAGGGLTYTAIQTANYSASITTVVRLDSSGGAFTVTLPATPADGSIVAVFDVANACGTNAVLVAPSGSDMVESDATGLSVNVSGAYVPLVYNSATTNWKIADTYSMAYTAPTAASSGDVFSPFLLMGA